ncbi:hypothetical protein ACFVVM_17380 [Nocardia sp. NPDC058176]|uniref:hypothetical protein n=1 Tax=Nocardia sp. NPDC058176 TaxID=3346368 RepID=UPI0036D8F74C
MIDTTTDTLVDTIVLPVYASDIAIDSSTRTIYIVSAVDRQTDHGILTVIDGATNTIRAQISVGTYALRVAVDETTHTAYVLGNVKGGFEDERGAVYSSVVSVVPEGSDSASTVVPVSPHYLQDIAIDPGAQVAYVVGTEVEAIDLTTHSRQNVPWPLPDASQAEFDPDTEKVFILNKKGGIAVLDPATSTVTDIYLGFGTDKDASGLSITYKAAFDPTAQAVYTLSDGLEGADDRMRVTDMATDAVAKTMALDEPRDLVVDPETHTLYALVKGEVVILPPPTLR